MKNFIVLIALVIGFFAAEARTDEPHRAQLYEVSMADAVKVTTSSSFSNKKNQDSPIAEKRVVSSSTKTLPEAPRKVYTDTRADFCTITLSLRYSEDYIPDDMIRICNDDEMYVVYLDQNDEGELYSEYQIEMPTGTFDIIVVFADYNYRPHFVINEQQEMKDGKSFVFDVEEATNEFHVIPTLPNGEVPVLMEGYFDDDYNFVATKKGNTGLVEVTSIFGFNGGEDQLDLTAYMTDFQTSEYNVITDYCVFTNDISDRYGIAIYWRLEVGDNVYISAYNSSSEKNATIKIDSSTNRKLDFEFGTTVVNQTQESYWKEMYNYYIFSSFYSDGFWLGNNYSESIEYKPIRNIFFNPSPNFQFGSVAATGTRPLGASLALMVDTGFGFDDLKIFQIKGAPTFIYNDDWFTPYSLMESNVNMNETSYGCLYHLDSPFSFYEKNNKLKRGNTAAFATIFIDNFEFTPGVINGFLMPQYYGYLGECRDIDQLAVEHEIKWNGKLVSTSDKGDSYTDFPWSFGNNPAHSTGVYEYYFLNENVIVDDMPSSNEIWIKEDWSTGDLNAPMLTRVTFKDADGNINDRFQKASEGKFIFGCADYKYKWDAERFFGWYDQIDKPAKLTVEYSPNARNNWTPLEYSEMDTEFNRLQGYMYEVDLSQVNLPSKTGWYDLRFRMEDEVGNYQTQTSTVCFKIDELTGVDTMETPEATIRAIYTPEGLRLTEPQKGVNIIVYSDGTTKKEICR